MKHGSFFCMTVWCDTANLPAVKEHYQGKGMEVLSESTDGEGTVIKFVTPWSKRMDLTLPILHKRDFLTSVGQEL